MVTELKKQLLKNYPKFFNILFVEYWFMEEKKFYNLKFLKRTALGSLLVSAVLFVLIPLSVGAQQLDTGIGFGAYTGLVDTDIRIIIAKIIRAALGVLGIVALGFTIYGGFLYTTAGGDEKKVETAKKIIKNMVIGLVIILSAFAITQFVINMLRGQYQGGGEETAYIDQSEFCQNCGFLGSIVESHYPGRGATGIARNTKIVITFKNELLASSLINDANNNSEFGDTSGASTGNNDKVKNTFKIYPTAQGESAAISSDEIDAFLSSDKKTYIFKPRNLLGSALEDTNYTIKLTDGVKLADGGNAFGAIGNYSWSFTVSTIVDLTPPQVTSIIPLPKTNRYDRNIIIQINFDEPVDPISASGLFRAGQTAPNNFQNITAATLEGSNPLIDGNYQITNQYRTVEFKTTDQCGVNPCGQPIYCLPGNKTILATVKSATIDQTNSPQAIITSNLYDGVVDMSGNSLNGGGELKRNDGGNLIRDPGLKSQALWQSSKDLDDFYWKFSTANSLDTTAPVAVSLVPNSLQGSVSVSAPVSIGFNKPMSISSFREIVLQTNKIYNVGYSYAGHNFDSSGNEVTTPDVEITRTTAEILHSDFWQKPVNAGADIAEGLYYPFVPSILNDIYQNCFYPAVLQNSTECIEADGGLNTENADRLTHINPSCFDLQASSYKQICNEDGGCPFNPPPHYAQ